jgi:hypothetical protein
VPRRAVASWLLRACALLVIPVIPASTPRAATLEVPSAYSTVQAAVNAAADGDVILLAPGVHGGRPTIAGKSVTLASRFHTTGDRAYIGQTIIDGGNGQWAVRVTPGAGTPTLVGLTLRNADDGIRATGKFSLLDCRITGTVDGVDYENGSGGLIRGCVFEGNADDAIDVDNAVQTVIEQNVIQNNGDDGIEIRLQAYTGPVLSIVIRDNRILGNGEDGVQIISYNLDTPRIIHIEGNLIAHNAMAGVGMMCCENTIENYQGAALKEYVGLFNNTIIWNDHGVTGGDNLLAVNNIIARSKNVGLKRARVGSLAAFNLFFANGRDTLQAILDTPTTLFADPHLTAEHSLGFGSPAIDAGCAMFLRNGAVVWRRALASWEGAAPDLGAIESYPALDVGPGARGGGVELLPPAPNPGRGSMTLAIQLPAAGRARLEILDVAGRRVRALWDGPLAAGRHDVTWDGTDASGRRVPAGVYLARLETATLARMRRLTLLD